MTTLVYIGANTGNSLWELFNHYDKVYAFEPDPEIFLKLSKRYKQFEWVTLVNAACSSEDGETNFYVHPNRVSSSLSNVDVDNYGGESADKVIKVKTLNLSNYLKLQGVDIIDFYYSDCQGSDFNILCTMNEYLESKSILKMYIETHGDGVFLYKNLDNQFTNFKKLLSNNYEFVSASLGRLGGKIVSENEIPENEYEWDSLWKLKE
jgi:FkbM family methyltransferase